MNAADNLEIPCLKTCSRCGTYCVDYYSSFIMYVRVSFNFTQSIQEQEYSLCETCATATADFINKGRTTPIPAGLLRH